MTSVVSMISRTAVIEGGYVGVVEGFGDTRGGMGGSV